MEPLPGPVFAPVAVVLRLHMRRHLPDTLREVGQKTLNLVDGIVFVLGQVRDDPALPHLHFFVTELVLVDLAAKRRFDHGRSRDEARALARWQKQREEAQRWEFYRSIPKRHWREMSGRPVKVINEQATRPGFAFHGGRNESPARVPRLAPPVSAC